MSNTQPVQENPRPRLFILAALLSLIGLTDSIYLTITHLTGEDVTCVASSGCSEVLSSAYSSVGSIPLGAFGALAYFAAFSLATLAAFHYRRARTFLTIVVAGMLVTTLWLLYVQAFVLHAFCDFCLLSAGLTLCLSAIVAVGCFTRRRPRTTTDEAPLLES
jgi:uncharacterized membrane protein